MMMIVNNKDDVASASKQASWKAGIGRISEVTGREVREAGREAERGARLYLACNFTQC